MSKLRHYRSIDQPTSANIRKKTMTAICFVCNLPIMSHQVGLVWQGGNGWDDLVREQLEESTIRQRLGGRRDSAAQISTPPSQSPPPGLQRRRRSSLAQLTDILREWSGGGAKQQTRSSKAPLNRRETLADLARSLPWRTSTTDAATNSSTTYIAPRKRRESSADSGIRSMRSRRDSNTAEFVKHWNRRESTVEEPTVIVPVVVESSQKSTSRRGSGESSLSGRRDSNIGRATTPPPPPKIIGVQPPPPMKKRDSLAAPEFPIFRQEQRPSTSSGGSDSVPLISTTNYNQVDTACQALPPPTIIMSSVTPPATSPTAPKGRRDSTTQCGRVNRRDSKAGVSPERAPRLQRLQRQATAFDESCLPGGSRRGSQPALSPDPPEEGQQRTSRRDSLSPDSASRGGRRDSRAHLSPDRSHDREGSPRRHTLRRQSSSAARSSRSPDSNSCCSSRDPSPCSRPPPLPVSEQNVRPAIRRQSTTEEILIARGFRRQSTTEEMIRCRNFRRQSSQSDDVCRYRGRRDSSAQIIDGTIGTMTVETTSTFFDSSTQTVVQMSLAEGNEDVVSKIQEDDAVEEEFDGEEDLVEEDEGRDDLGEEVGEVSAKKKLKKRASIFVNEPKDEFSADSDETLDEDFPQVGSFVLQKQIIEPPDFFTLIGRIPDIDEISLDSSIQRFLKRTASIAGSISEDEEGEAKAEEEHVEPEPVAPMPESDVESSSSTEISEIDFDFSASEEEDLAPIISDEHLFDALVEVETKPAIVIEEPDFEEMARQEAKRQVTKNVFEFLRDLVDCVVEEAEFIDPRVVLRENLDKLKLLRELYEKCGDLHVERKVNHFLSRKCVDFYRRKKVYRPITADPIEQFDEEVRKFKEAISSLDELLGREAQSREMVSQRVRLLEAEVARLEKIGKTEISQLEHLIRKTYAKRASDRLNVFTDKRLLEMEELRQDLSRVRYMLIQRQHTMARLMEKTEALQNLGKGLLLSDFENMTSEMISLEKKLEERSIDLDKIRNRFNTHTHVLAHVREKQTMMYHSLQIQADSLKEASDEKHMLRERIFKLKTSRVRVKKEIRELSFQNGLIGKPAMLLEYDETVARNEQLKGIVEGMKLEIIRIEKKLEGIKARF